MFKERISFGQIHGYVEEPWILGWTVIPFQLKSPLQLPSGSIKSHYYGWRKKFTTYKSCLPNKSDCYFLQIWTHKGRVKKNSHGVKRWIKKTRMSADNLQKVESHLDIWRNFWKANFFLGINLLFARFFCCRWLSIEDNQWSVITIIALLWLADCLFLQETRGRCNDGEKVYCCLTEGKNQNERLVYFLHPARALFIKRVIYHVVPLGNPWFISVSLLPM